MSEVAEKKPVRTQHGSGAAGVWVWIAVGLTVFGALAYAFTLVTGYYNGSALLGHLVGDVPVSFIREFGGMHLRAGAKGDILDVPLEYRLLALVPSVILAVTAVLAGRLLTRALSEIRRGDAFSPAAVRAWPRLARVFLLGAVINLGAQFAVFLALKAYAMDGPRPAWEDSYVGVTISGVTEPTPWFLILLGVVAGALAAAFRQGARLQEDVEGVI